MQGDNIYKNAFVNQRIPIQPPRWVYNIEYLERTKFIPRIGGTVSGTCLRRFWGFANWIIRLQGMV